MYYFHVILQLEEFEVVKYIQIFGVRRLIRRLTFGKITSGRLEYRLCFQGVDFRISSSSRHILEVRKTRWPSASIKTSIPFFLFFLFSGVFSSGSNGEWQSNCGTMALIKKKKKEGLVLECSWSQGRLLGCQATNRTLTYPIVRGRV